MDLRIDVRHLEMDIWIDVRDRSCETNWNAWQVIQEREKTGDFQSERGLGYAGDGKKKGEKSHMVRPHFLEKR